jgi:hypothetical protein
MCVYWEKIFSIKYHKYENFAKNFKFEIIFRDRIYDYWKFRLNLELEYLNSTPPPWSRGGVAKNWGKWSGVVAQIQSSVEMEWSWCEN